MRLEPAGDGTRLVWEVAYRTYVPGLGLLTNWLVGRSVRRSLAALERLLRRQATAAEEPGSNQPLQQTGGGGPGIRAGGVPPPPGAARGGRPQEGGRRGRFGG